MITYFDTSMLMKLVVDDELLAAEAARLWLDSEFVLCAEIGYAETRAALAAAHRSGRLESTQFDTAKRQFEQLWTQISIVNVNSHLIRSAGDVAESDSLRGYDAVHLASALVASARVMASANQRITEAASMRGLSTV